MGLVYNGTEIKAIQFNGTDILYVDYNGQRVWSKERTISATHDSYIQSVEGTGNYIVGELCTLKANPKPKDNTGVLENDYAYYFEGWYINDEKVSSDQTYTFVVTENVTIEARGRREARLIVVYDGTWHSNKYNVTASKWSDSGDSGGVRDVNVGVVSSYFSMNNLTKIIVSCSGHVGVPADNARYANWSIGGASGGVPTGQRDASWNKKVIDVSSKTGETRLYMYGRITQWETAGVSIACSYLALYE